MPRLLIHCRRCGALLNTDLQSKPIPPPEFVRLEEIESMIDVHPIGYYVGCPHCQKELRIHGKYVGERVQCKFCFKPFQLDLDGGDLNRIAFYTDCPHCRQQIRAADKYMGANVACKFCNGAMHFVEHANA
ncbi:MAG: hypothetical protein R3C02_03855 [Planctomycetaceae bacterium]